MPYEALFGEKPDLSNLRIIGCQAWALISKEKRSKFDLRFSDCRLLGYAASMQYILYEVDSGRVIFSCDVIFDELLEFYSSNWIFDFDLSDELLLSICLYTQKSLSSEANIESSSAPRVIDCVEASTAESSAKLLAKLVKSPQPVKWVGKQRVKLRGRSWVKLMSKSMNESSMSLADMELNEKS